MPDRIVAVKWLDASQHSGYFKAEDVTEIAAGKGARMVSVGFLVDVEDREGYVLLAQTRNQFRWGDILSIPAACIEAIVDFTLADTETDTWIWERPEEVRETD